MYYNDEKRIQVSDTITFVLHEDQYNSIKSGEKIEFPPQKLSSDVTWQALLYPKGYVEEGNRRSYYDTKIDERITIVIKSKKRLVGMSAKDENNYSVGISLVPSLDNYNSPKKNGNLYILRLHNNVQIKDKLVLKLTANFELLVPPVYPAHCMYLTCQHIPKDFALVVNNQSIEVHEYFLIMLSPVFTAMVTHDMKEKRLRKLDIKDFPFEVVKAAIDFCYGHEVNKHMSIKSFVQLLRFADKYDIKSIITVFEPRILETQISGGNFWDVFHYAYDMSYSVLITKCVQFFTTNNGPNGNNVLQEVDENVPIPVVMHLISVAHGTTDNLSIVNVACRNNINNQQFIVEYVKKSLMQNLSMETFCQTADFACKYNVYDLQRQCAKFFKAHQIQITTKPDFINLEPTTIRDILKTAATLR